jgi:hypothetical protein
MNSKDYIKVIPNFLPDADIDAIISYIEGKFPTMPDGQKVAGMSFGKDYQEDRISYMDLSTLEPIKDLIVNKYTPEIIRAAQSAYNDNDDLYLSVIWLNKHTAGSDIYEHEDQWTGNTQFKYSCILYLNSMDNDGVLEFTKLGYSYTPKRGDLLMFPSNLKDSQHTVKSIKSNRYTVPTWLTADKNNNLLN